MRNVMLLLTMLFLASCKKEKHEYMPRNFSVVPDMGHAIRDTTGKYIEFGCDYYLNHNFIVDDSSTIYYYPHRYIPYVCGTGEYNFEDYRRAPFIYLQPHQLIVLRETMVNDFIDSNIINKDISNFIIVSSARDTFQSRAIDSLLEKTFRNSDRTYVVIRRMTQEEKEVLKHKKSGIPYYPSEIKWDTTKTKFEPKYIDLIR